MTNRDIVANNPKMPPKKIPWFRSGYGWAANWVIKGYDLSLYAQKHTDNKEENPYWEVKVYAFPLQGPKCCGISMITGKTRDITAQEAMKDAIGKTKTLQEDTTNI